MTQLATLIALMDSVSPAQVSTLVIKPTQKGCALLAVSPDCTIQLNASALVLEGLKDPVAVDAKTLLGACKNRDVTLSVNGSEIVVKSGKSYSATVACSADVPAIAEGLSKLEGEESVQVTLSQDSILAIKAQLTKAKIERTFTGIVDTLVAIKATSKTLVVMNYEPAQVASVTTKNETGIEECFFVLPSSVLQKAVNIIGPMKVTIGESCAIFQSKTCLLRVNLPIDTINAIDKNAVLQLLASVKNTDSQKPSLTTTKSSLKNFLDNAESLIQIGGNVVIAPATGNYIQASVTTVKGAVKEKFAGSAGKGFSLGYAFMRAIVSRAKDGTDIELKTTDSFAIVKTGSSTYIASLSED